MRRALLAVVLAALAVLPLFGATSAASVFVAPAAGSQDETFTFSGAGFPAGTRLAVTFVSPDGQQFELKTSKGKPAVWQVDPSGVFAFDITPFEDFAGGAAGTWKAEFCVEAGSDCWSGTFDISL